MPGFVSCWCNATSRSTRSRRSTAQVVSSQALRDQVHFAVTRGHSKRRACELIDYARSTLRYQRKLRLRDALALKATRRIAQQYPRYGYRRIRIFLRREGLPMSTNRIHRTWKLAGLQLPMKRPQRRISTSRPRPLPPTGPNGVRAYDSVYDTRAEGKALKCLTVIDEFTRECLAIGVAASIRSMRVIDVQAKLISVRGAPMYLRSDNGLEFVATTLLKWAAQNKIETALVDPSKPWQNCATESFNGKFRGVPVARTVPQPPESTGRDPGLNGSLQRGPSAFEPGISHAQGVRRTIHPEKGFRRSQSQRGNGLKKPGRSSPNFPFV